MEKLGLQYPKVYQDGKSPLESSYVGRSPSSPYHFQYCTREKTGGLANVMCDKDLVYEARPYYDVRQAIKHLDDSTMKVSTATRMVPVTSNIIEYKTVQTLTNDGFYSVARTKNGKLIGGYEAKPFTRKFAEGFKGKLQKFAINIATDSKGCERPVLKRVGSALFDLAKKIK